MRRGEGHARQPAKGVYVNARDRFALPDIQSQLDTRNIEIAAVGVKGVRHPVMLLVGETLVPTIATLSMTVGLSATAKGTHMSRFLEILELQAEPLSQRRFRVMTIDMLERLSAHSGSVVMRFPYFVRKQAPISGVQSHLDYDVCWRGIVAPDNRYSFWMRVTVPATSLCPCSKEISDYGAHNQRSHIVIDAQIEGEMSVDEVIAIAERSASCEIYGLLKRSDEKYVTERAYDNPKFVEDLVRDVGVALNGEPRVLAYTVEAENFESIHNHSAFARVVRRSPSANLGHFKSKCTCASPAEDVAA
jgi:GTP cyclohydrolase FolE2